VSGQDEGDWIRVLFPKKETVERFLPKQNAQGDECLEHKGEDCWRVVDSSGQQRPVSYRRTKNFDDKDGHVQPAPLDTMVTGQDEGDWIRVLVPKDVVGNVPPGTVLDDGIAHPDWQNFYLCSHPAMQRNRQDVITVKAPHYYVLLDQNDFVKQRKRLQQLLLHLCFNYGRCTRSVSYPTPTYYADLLCDRARVWLQALHPQSLDDWSDTASSLSMTAEDIEKHVRTANSLFTKEEVTKDLQGLLFWL